MSLYSKQRTRAEQSTHSPTPRFTRAHPVGAGTSTIQRSTTESRCHGTEESSRRGRHRRYIPSHLCLQKGAGFSFSFVNIAFPYSLPAGSRASLPAKTIIVKSAYTESRSIRFRALNKQQLNVIPAQRKKFSVLLPLLAFVGCNAKDKATARKSLFHVLMCSGLGLCSWWSAIIEHNPPANVYGIMHRVISVWSEMHQHASLEQEWVYRPYRIRTSGGQFSYPNGWNKGL